MSEPDRNDGVADDGGDYEKDGPRRWLPVKTGRHRIKLLQAMQIEWIEGAGNYVYLHAAGERMLFRENLGTLEAQLDPDVFVRVHRSAIVNLHSIASIEPWFSGDLVLRLKDGTEVRASRNYRDRLRALIGRPA